VTLAGSCVLHPQVLTPEHKGLLPRVHGLRPAPQETIAETAWPERLPPAPAGQKPWLEQEPVPMTARRGQVLILCSSCLHSAWQNQDVVPRKAMGSSWAAATVACGLPRDQLQGLRDFFPRLRARLPAHRRHIVPAPGDENIFETNYRPLWTETFDWAAGPAGRL
jgi:hypothetical protein